MGAILKENHLIHTNKVGGLLLGSSCWRFDEKRNVLTTRKTRYQEVREHLCSRDNSYRIDVQTDFLDKIDTELVETASCERKLKRVGGYKLNKKKVREKCHALFTLKRSAKFMAFYSISFPQGISDKEARVCLNTWLTRCREKYKLTHYLWVAERQNNGTIHFHLITNNYMPIREVNRYMAVCISNRKERYNLDIQIDVDKYNGIDVRRIDNNRKRLGQYLTKYVSKNDVAMDNLCYYSSQSVSRLFTAQYLRSESEQYNTVMRELSNLHTIAIDNDFCTIEYFTTIQPNGKYFSPPESWYEFIQKANDLIIYNYEFGALSEDIKL